MIDIDNITIPEHLKDKSNKVKALLYYKTLGLSQRESLIKAGIRVYNTKYQFNSIVNNKKIDIFCKQALINPTKKVNINGKVSKDSILQLCANIISDSKSSDNVKVRAMDLQNKILDSGDYSLDSNKPIYIITASRRLDSANTSKS